MSSSVATSVRRGPSCASKITGSVSRNRGLEQNEAVCGRDPAITGSPGLRRCGGAERRRGFLTVPALRE